MGMPPASITTLVCSEVPEAILVSAQAASNCSGYKNNNDTYKQCLIILLRRSAYRVVISLKELNEGLHYPGVNDLLYRRLAL
jgi:hypothetical protein